MDTRTLIRIGTGALAGAAVALLVGLVAVALAPDDGFGDLAAAAVTRVFLVPAAAIAGGIVAHRRGRHGSAGTA